IMLLRQQKSGLSARLYSLAVHDDSRGRGIGQRLLTTLIAECVTRGVRRIHLQVESSNTTAQRLYQRHDFHTVETLPDYYRPQRDGIHMVCNLTQDATATPPSLKPAA
ncbi:MAG: GNAT family N-acetyltransferase, partial [Phycisphaerae bacterium]|nr:GNAT family N-acetyltransferase [Phycisphaerae bacterium]